jgi:hypothetical protein
MPTLTRKKGVSSLARSESVIDASMQGSFGRLAATGSSWELALTLFSGGELYGSSRGRFCFR